MVWMGIVYSDLVASERCAVSDYTQWIEIIS